MSMLFGMSANVRAYFYVSDAGFVCVSVCGAVRSGSNKMRTCAYPIRVDQCESEWNGGLAGTVCAPALQQSHLERVYVCVRVYTMLYSDIDGCVPQNARSRGFCDV